MKTITKIKITKNLTAEIAFVDRSGIENEAYTFSSTAIIHQDFYNAMQALTEDFISMTEQDCEHNLITITGITTGGSDENKGATIVGQRLLSGNRVLNLVAPFTKYEDMTKSTRINIANALNEAELFIEGKRKPDPQQEIEFPNE